MKDTVRVILGVGLFSVLFFYAYASGQEVASVTTVNSRPTWVEQAKLTASDGQEGNFFGSSSAIWDDTIVIGTSGLSEAYVFVKPSTGWSDTTETAKLTPSNGPINSFGSSVGISGNTVIVGAPDVNTVYVYVKPATGWVDMTESARLSAGDGNGSEVVISGDIVASASTATSDKNYVFIKPPGGWKTVTHSTTTLHTPGGGGCGLCIGIGADTIAVGVPSNFLDEGTVYVFVKPKSGWRREMQPEATLIASDPALSDEFGFSVSMSTNTIVVGAPYHANVGAIYVFEKPTGGWTSMTEAAELAARDGLATGTSVGVTANGMTIVTGSPQALVGANEEQGAVYTFARPKDGWKTTKRFNSELTASDGAAKDQLGTSLGVSGTTIVTGAPQAMVNGNYAQGAAYVFAK
jgi:hypothetical protein